MISKRAKEVLNWLKENEHDDYLVVSGLEVWYGLNRTNWGIVLELITFCFISEDSICKNSYYINHAGKRYLEGLPPYRDTHGQYHANLADLFTNKEKK